MDGQPVALEGGHQRRNLCVNPGDDGRQGDRQKSKGSDENPYDFLPVLEFENQIDQNNGPRKENERFVHIGQGDIAITRLMCFQPTGEQAA